MVEIIQEYTTDALGDYCAFNIFLDRKRCKIKLLLGSLMDRKNMAFDRLVKKINNYFLLEYLCAMLESQGLWCEEMCENGHNCRIKQVLKRLDHFCW